VGKSDSTAGDLAERIANALGEDGLDVEWIPGTTDELGVVDGDGIEHFVKVELA